ncbi:60S ribosomal protein L31 [Candidatus Woesearchaeota archaeon]|nr:60S ribosomal protein L31 [Candidatus Woesearchaeota archaeon]
MAEKEKTKKKEKKEAKKVLERTYNVPLRKEWLKSPRWNRTKKAVSALRAFIAKHMKSDDVKIGKYVNLELWKHGIKNPPHHVKVNCVKFDDGKVIAELFGRPIEEEKPKEKPKKEEKPKEAEGKEEKIEKIEERLGGKKEDKLEEAKEIEKEEIEELKKEHPKSHTPKETAKQPFFKEHRREMIPGR